MSLLLFFVLFVMYVYSLHIYLMLNYLQLVFLVLTGEAWGYLGSRRFLAELDMSADTVNGLDSSLIERVLVIINFILGDLFIIWNSPFKTDIYIYI